MVAILNIGPFCRLRKALESGGGTISDTFELLIGQPMEAQSVVVDIRTGDELYREPVFGFGPLATVKSSVHGDIEGEFLLVQKQTDFLALSGIMESHLVGEKSFDLSVNKRPPFWKDNPWHGDVLPQKMRALMKDLLTEAGNMLFGSFLTAVHEEFGLTTYQGLSRATVLDVQQVGFQESISRNRRESNVSAVIDIRGIVAGRNIQIWLIFMPLVSGISSILEARRSQSRPQRKAAANVLAAVS